MNVARARELAAQTAQIGVATADLYPRFTLSGFFSFDSFGASDLFKADSHAWGFGPQVRWNIFDGGRIRSNIDAQDALTEQALYSYENTVLEALEEVENAMVNFVQENDRRDRLFESVEAARDSVRLVRTSSRRAAAR